MLRCWEGGELAVENQQIGSRIFGKFLYLLKLSRADKCGGIGTFKLLYDPSDCVRTCGICKFFKLVKKCVAVLNARIYRHENGFSLVFSRYIIKAPRYIICCEFHFYNIIYFKRLQYFFCFRD